MPRIDISVFTYFSLIYIFTCTDRETLAALLAAVLVHESAHIIFIAAFGCRIDRVRVTPLGVSIHRSNRSSSLTRELIVYLSGPAASILLFAIFIILGRRGAGYVSLFYGLINIIPVGIFDGGKALRSLLSELAPYRADAVMKALNFVFIILIWIASLYFMIRHGSFLSMFTMSVFLFTELFVIRRDFR